MKWAVLGVALLAHILYSADTLFVDNNTAALNWVGKKVTGEHDGSINMLEGWVVVDKNTLLGGAIIIDMHSIANRDIESAEWRLKFESHLKNEDFFYVDSFPTSHLNFSKEQPFILSDTTLNKISADLTIRGNTHPVDIPCIVTNGDNNYKISGDFNIDRTLFNIKYGSGKFFDDLGDRMIYDDFTIKFDLRLKKSIDNFVE